MRRSLLQSYSPRIKRSLAPNLTAENVQENDAENPIGDTLEALEKGTILTPKQDRVNLELAIKIQFMMVITYKVPEKVSIRSRKMLIISIVF